MTNSLACHHTAPPIIASVPTPRGWRWTATCRSCARSWMGGSGHTPEADLPEAFLAVVIAHLLERGAAGEAPACVTNLVITTAAGPTYHAPYPIDHRLPLCGMPAPDPDEPASTYELVNCQECRALRLGAPGIPYLTSRE